MTTEKKDPHPHLPGGTGTGVAGGAPVKPTTPARDPAAEAAALAAFEQAEDRAKEQDLPAEKPAPKAKREPEPEPEPRKAKPEPEQPEPRVEGGAKMEPLGKPVEAPPVVVF